VDRSEEQPDFGDSANDVGGVGDTLRPAEEVPDRPGTSGGTAEAGDSLFPVVE
jgi:hypothetical protein